MLDFNDADPQRAGDLIPNGTIARVIGTIRPGGANRPGQNDGGWLTQSKTSDVLYLSWEFTLVDGPHAKRKFWQNMTVAGGEVNEKGDSKAGNITKTTLRAILNSARGVKPDDNSERALTARRISSWEELSGLEFVVKIGVRKGSNGYQDQNQVATVIEPGHKDYGAGGSDAMAPVAATAPAAAWAKPAAGNGGGSTPAWAR